VEVMDMWKLKSCPKCTGDLYIEQRQEECEEQCLQCGYKREYIIEGLLNSESRKLVTAAGVGTER
jgi:hypothetical protein